MTSHASPTQFRNRRRLFRLVPLLLLAALLVWRLLPPRRGAIEAPPSLHDLTLSEAQEVQVEIVPGDCCAVALERGGMEAGDAARLVADVKPAYDLARIRSGQT